METVRPVTIVKHEVRTLASQNPDRSLMYPAPMALTWIKVPGMPWVLTGIAPHQPSLPPAR